MSNVDSCALAAPEIEAEVYYLKEAEGGRKTPVGNGYRGQLLRPCWSSSPTSVVIFALVRCCHRTNFTINSIDS